MSNYRVHIPDCIIRNENDININSKEFMLYYYLKILYDKQRSSKVKFNHNQYMGKFGIKSNPTLKKMLNSLYENNLILSGIDSLPRTKQINIELNKEYIGIEPFTIIHINLYYLVDRIGHEGLRLMYYYESRINRTKHKEDSKGNKTFDNWFSYAGIRTIEKETKINRNKITECNKEMIRLKILKVENSDLSYSGEYDEFDQEVKTKYTNKYYPLINKLDEYKF